MGASVFVRLAHWWCVCGLKVDCAVVDDDEQVDGDGNADDFAGDAGK